ncbi:MAG: glycosyltransferase, partial [Segetibacter sp.]
MIKVVWLTQYNVYELLPEIQLTREVVLHSSSWIHTLSEALALEKEISLHIITHSPLVSHSQTIGKNGIEFHVIKYNFPFTDRGFPEYLPFDKLSGYHSFKKEAAEKIRELRPDVLHVHGTEGGYFTAAIDSDLPCIVSIQGIISEYIKIEPSVAGYLQIFYERQAVQRAKYFGCR